MFWLHRLLLERKTDAKALKDNNNKDEVHLKMNRNQQSGCVIKGRYRASKDPLPLIFPARQHRMMILF